MPTFDESLGTVRDVIASAPEGMRSLLEAAHARLLELDPDAVVVPRRGERSISYGIGPKKMSEAYAYLIPFARHVNLGFFHGTVLSGSERLEGNGRAMRHLKIRTREDLMSQEATRLVREAIAERRRA